MKSTNRKAVKAVIEVTTRELFANYANSTLDVVWERDASDLEDILTEPLETIHRECEERIRKLFRDGNTMMLLGGLETLERADCAEIFVTRRDGTIFVVANDDIQY